MEAVDANLCMDQWLLVVMLDSVRKYDLRLIQQITPESITHGEIRELQPKSLAPNWKKSEAKDTAIGEGRLKAAQGNSSFGFVHGPAYNNSSDWGDGFVIS